MGENLERARAFSIATLFIILAIGGIAFSDIVLLNTGKEIEGHIEEEWESFITVNTGSSVITIQKDSITTIVKSVFSGVIIHSALESLERGTRLVNDGKMLEARRFFEMEILKLEQILSSKPKDSHEIIKVKTLLENARRKAIPPDAKNEEIEQTYRKALNALDRVNYEEAFHLLKQVRAMSHDRPDVLVKLGVVARQLNYFDDAISAFHGALEIDASNYYGEVSPLLLELLENRGKQLLVEKKDAEALDCYRKLLLLRSDVPKRPVQRNVFLQRLESHRKQSEQEMLTRIFQFAEETDSIALAMAAINRLREILPEDEHIRRTAAETIFLRDFTDALQKANLVKAARLKSDAPNEVLQSQRVSLKIERLMRETQPEYRARITLSEARNSFQKERYEDSLNLYRKFLAEFPESPQAPEASESLQKAAFESPIEKSINQIREYLKVGDVEQAEKVLENASSVEGVKDSLQWRKIQDCSRELEMEKTARQSWMTARDKFKTRAFEDSLKLMIEIENNFPDSFTGKKASAYLQKNRNKIEQRIEEQRVIGEDIFIDLSFPAMTRGDEKPSPQRIALARSGFEKLMESDLAVRDAEKTPPILWSIVLTIGAIFSVFIVYRWAPLGFASLKNPIPIQDWEQGFVQKGENIIFEDPQCRFCGLELESGADACNHCGASILIHEEELNRNRFNNFYGAKADDEEDASLREKELEEHFKVAEELTDAGNMKAALKMALMAYHDDPRQMKCLELLAGLYEKMKKPEEALLCYHRILMLDSTHHEAALKIEKFKSVLSALPVRATALVNVLSFAFWWMVFWTASGIDPWGWAFLPRMGLALLGFIITSLLWNYQIKRRFIHPEERFETKPGYYHPISRKNLKWKDLNRQADFVDKIIYEHTGVRPPKLRVGALFAWLAISALFLCALTLAGMLNQYPAVLLAWFGGIVLLIGLMEFYPRMRTIHILLRHFYDELQSSWADPEIPFKTHRLETQEEGEFNTKTPGPLPMSWAMNPAPYKATRQGFLNGVLQTLNRHAGFHYFYKNLKIENPGKMAMPAGFPLFKCLTLAVIALTIFAAAYLFYFKTDQKTQYLLNVRSGFEHLLQNRVDEAMERLYNARQIDARGFAPDFFLGFACARKGLHRLADRYFSCAAFKGADVAAVHEQYGEYLRNRGRKKEAIREYKRALETEPENADVLNNLGMAYFNISELPLSISYLNLSIAIDPANAQACLVLGMAYEESGETAKSRDAFEKAIQADSSAPFAKLARSRLDAGESRDIQAPQ